MPTVLEEPGEFRAWVTCRGEALEIYGITNHPLAELTKGHQGWICSLEDKSYQVHFENIRANWDVQVDLFLDDECVSRRIIQGTNRTVIDGIEDEADRRMMRPFVFRAPELTDDPDCATTQGEHMGAIFVQATRVKTRPRQATSTENDRVMTRRMVALKDTKVLHCTALGNPIRRRGRNPVSGDVETKRYDKHGARIAFEFRYRPYETLQIMGLVTGAKRKYLSGSSDAAKPSTRSTSKPSAKKKKTA